VQENARTQSQLSRSKWFENNFCLAPSLEDRILGRKSSKYVKGVGSHTIYGICLILLSFASCMPPVQLRMQHEKGLELFRSASGWSVIRAERSMAAPRRR
jgi:hypothetical protein